MNKFYSHAKSRSVVILAVLALTLIVAREASSVRTQADSASVRR